MQSGMTRKTMRIQCCAILTGFVLCASLGWTEEPVRIGVLLSLDGRAGALGREAWAGIRHAYSLRREVFNRPIEIVLADAGSDPSRAVMGLFRLVDGEKVSAVIGDVTACCTLAGSAHAERRHIPIVSLSGPISGIAGRHDYIVWTGVSDKILGEWCAQASVKLLGSRTAAIIQDDVDEFSISVATHFGKAFTALGGRIVQRVGLRGKGYGFHTELERIRLTQPEVLFAPLFVTHCALVAKQAKRLGLSSAILATDRANHPDLAAVGGPDVEGLCLACVTQDKGSGPVCSNKIDSFGEHPTLPTMSGSWKRAGANAYTIVVEAIERAQSLDGDTIYREAAALQSARLQPREPETKAGVCPSNALSLRRVVHGRFIETRLDTLLRYVRLNPWVRPQNTNECRK
jgi:branched-chain amino acid transport system substrate-binding protein